ncbi:MAG TPA: hypothetical protein VFC47_14765 [Caulobacteraceae bacterium]|nr:hypothetical protein [Caulobacteraceae bacterium]
MDETSGQYRLNLLGAFRLAGPDGARIEIASRKGVALIAMLAMANQGERSRGWLQDKLWGSRQQTQARGSLRRELADLRKSLNAGSQPLLIGGHDRVGLDLRHVYIDARAPDGADDEFAGPANGLSQDFLEGLDIAGEEGFEAWLREQRGAQRERARTPRRPGDDGTAAGGGHRRQPAVPTDARGRPSVAVLRFEHAPGDAEGIYLAEGIAEEIISALARSRLISVTSRHSSLAYDPQNVGARAICADLGVEYIVQGHIRRVGEVLRVSAALVAGAKDKTIWSERYDRRIDDLLAVQDQITAAIIGTLEPALLGHEEIQALHGGARNPRHWDLFMRGRWHFWRATRDDWAIAHEFLTGALVLEPEDVPTLSHLALCRLGEVWAGVAEDPGAAITEANRLALKAVSLDGSDAYAHNILGTALSLMGRFEEAMAEQRRALELNPYLAAADGELGRLSVFAGRLDEAIAHSDRAIAASPNDPHVFVWFRSKALARFVAREYGEAARHAADACARSPHQFFLHYLLAACHGAAGDLARARIAIEEGRRLQPRYTLEMIKLACPFADPEPFARYIEALGKAGWDGEQVQRGAAGSEDGR